MITNTLLYNEIHQQPSVLRSVLNTQRDQVAELAAQTQARGITHVVIAARGTSDNAARYAQYILGANDGLTVTLATPSLFSVYERPPQFGNALVLGISQSGRSPDIVGVVAEGRRQGALTAVITNKLDSPLAEQGDVVIDLCAGEEKAVAATKTYTASLAALALFSAALSSDPALMAQLEGVPTAVADTLMMNSQIAQIAPRYRYMERSVVIGRGFNYSTAFELALKLKELTYTIVQPYSSADFKHGPLAMLEEGFPVLLIAPSGKMLSQMRVFAEEAGSHGAELIVISDDDEILDAARIPLKLPHPLPEWLSPLTCIIPGQLLAMHLAHTRDFDVDAPRAIRKVTETH